MAIYCYLPPSCGIRWSNIAKTFPDEKEIVAE